MLVPVPIRCRIPDILRSKGLTQSWLADKTGLTKQRISDYVRMRDGRITSLQVAYLIANTLKVSPSDLYEWVWQKQE
jgi:transcriptional regulator with XRE-family HTH domain